MVHKHDGALVMERASEGLPAGRHQLCGRGDPVGQRNPRLDERRQPGRGGELWRCGPVALQEARAGLFLPSAGGAARQCAVSGRYLGARSAPVRAGLCLRGELHHRSALRVRGFLPIWCGKFDAMPCGVFLSRAQLGAHDVRAGLCVRDKRPLRAA